jgi:hypothetical protein
VVASRRASTANRAFAAGEENAEEE